MLHRLKRGKIDIVYLIAIGFLISISLLVLRSIANNLFPLYFFYIAAGMLAFYIFSTLDFEILSLFSKHFYVLSVLFLLLPLFIGNVTRGAVRWLQIGALTIQPAEIVKPFLVLHFSVFLLSGKNDTKKFIKAIILGLIPIYLIMVQPSLGVSLLLAVAYFGTFLASQTSKKYVIIGLVLISLAAPVFWMILAPYQKERVITFITGSADPLGAGYNAIQSTISVGSGEILGKGLGKGVQTQLAFLPEKHTDFIFAAIAEELGFLGSIILVVALFVLFYKIAGFIEISVNPIARAFVTGIFLSLQFQVFVNIGMNMGLVPITGLPLPLVSAGGSSFLGTMISLGIISASRKKLSA